MDGQRLTLTRANDITAFMVASGDGDFTELARTITDIGKRLIIVSVGKAASRELIALANPFIPIENLLGLTPPPGPIPEPTGEVSTYDWETFIHQLAKAEAFFNKTGAFVGFTHFAEKWLTPQMGPIATPEDRRKLVNAAVDLRVAESYQVPTPQAARPLTWAVKLNRNHPLVEKVLGQQPS